MVKAGCSESMGAAVDRLWQAEIDASQIAAAARAFAEAECTELNYVKHLRSVLAPQA
jgi:hypothetical protein